MFASRRKLLKVAMGAFGATAISQFISNSATATEEPDEDAGCEALFVLSAKKMSFDGKSITLHGPNPSVVYFCDRPVREAGHLTLEALVAHTSVGENSFKENPPNAAISIFGSDGSVNEIVVTLPSAPTINADTVKFEIINLDGTLPAEGGAISMFIDPIGRPLSPTSVAGVHRRHRRKAVRRRN